MLVLSRSQNDQIQIGDDITVTVISVDARGRVRLGITAPRHIPVNRMEVLVRRANAAVPAGLAAGAHEEGKE
jgi:carbon storage regulator CsrA